jgi:RHS repeat-associated protein
LNVDENYQRSDASGSHVFLTDVLDSTLALLDSAGKASVQYSYDPFGNTSATGSSSNSSQYTGRENDGTGMYYYRARYYRPAYGRFISEDPLGFASGEINLYAYVRNNPVSLADPSGLNTFQVGLAGMGSGFGLGFGVSFGVAVDDHGNYGFYVTPEGGAAIGVGFSGGAQVAVSNAATINDLSGWFGNLSIGAASGFAATGDMFIGGDSNGNPVTGGGFSVGAGLGGSALGGPCYTFLNCWAGPGCSTPPSPPSPK